MTRRVKGEVKDFPVYTKQEAEEKGLQYKPWRQCNTGDWGLSDDGYVSECLRRRSYMDRYGRTLTQINFPYARVWDKESQLLEWLPQRVTGKFFDGSIRTWQEREAGKTRTRNVVKLYVAQMLAGKIDYEMLGRAYRPDQKIPAATARRLFRQDKIQELVCRELGAVLKRSRKGRRTRSTCESQCATIASGQLITPCEHETCNPSQSPIEGGVVTSA